jgi:WD domain, G-beta repeat
MAAATRSKGSENRLRRVWLASVPDHIISLAWSPDGKQLAAAAVSGPIVVVDVASGKIRTTLTGHGFGTTTVTWKPTGELLASAGQDGKVRIWDTTLWQERAALDGGSAWVEQLAFHPTGALLASGAGKKVRIWDAAGEMVREYVDHPSTVADLAWRGTQLSVATYGGVRLYDTTAPDVKVEYAWKGAPLKMAWSPNGNMLAHGNQDATVHFWFANKPEKPLQMSGYATKIRELSWDQSSKYLACGGTQAVCIWDCGGSGPEGSKPRLLKGHQEPLTALAWQRRGFLIASACPAGLVNLWQPANRKEQRVGNDVGLAEVTSLAWSPDDQSLAVGGADGVLRLLKLV